MSREKSQVFRDQALEMVWQRDEEVTIKEMAIQLCINYGTLKTWLRLSRQSKSGLMDRQGSSVKVLTLEQKLALLLKADTLSAEALNRFRRQYGLFKHQFDE